MIEPMLFRRSSSSSLSCLPTPPNISDVQPCVQHGISSYKENSKMAGEDAARTRRKIDFTACSMHIAGLLFDYSTITRQRIEQILIQSSLPMEIIAAAASILAGLSDQFYLKLRSQLSRRNILGEVALISSLMVAKKYLDDHQIELGHWTNIACTNITKDNLTAAELLMLFSVEFRLAQLLDKKKIDIVFQRIELNDRVLDLFARNTAAFPHSPAITN
ncbi:hypothetical protein V1511DRAFT_510210 [Dipodascopsis uninucleata]